MDQTTSATIEKINVANHEPKRADNSRRGRDISRTGWMLDATARKGLAHHGWVGRAFAR